MKKIVLFAAMLCFVGTTLFAQNTVTGNKRTPSLNEAMKNKDNNKKANNPPKDVNDALKNKNKNNNNNNNNNNNAAQNTNNSAAQTAQNNAKDINDVISRYNSLNKKLDTKYTGYEEALPPYIISGNYAYQLVKKPHDISKEEPSKSEIFAQDLSNIYPGAVVYVDGDLADGNPRLVGLDPGKVTLSVDFNPGKGCASSASGVTNTASEVYDKGIYKILNGAKNYPSISYDHKYRYASSLNELTWSLGVDAKFLKNTVKVNTNTTSRQSTVTEVEDWTQKYYTVKCNWESDASKYFGPNVTGPQVKDKIAKNGPIGIITSVTYGRRAYIFKDVTSSNFKFHGDESVNIYGQKASSVQDIVKNAKDSSVWMWVSGSDAGSSALMLKGKNIRNAMSKCLKYNPDTNQGTPLYYTVKVLGTNKTVNVQPIGTYTTVEYIPMPKYVSCTFKNNAFVIAGGGLKMRIDYKVVTFDSKGNKVAVTPAKDVEAGYSRYVEYGMGKGDSKKFDLDLKTGEFLDGPIRVQLRQKRHSTGKWYNSVVTKVYPKNSELIIICDGSIRPDGKDAYIHSSSTLVYAKDNQ